METVELENLVRDIYITLTEARNLIYNGREIQCDRKLQGCLKKCENILMCIQEIQQPNPDQIIEQTSEEKKEE